MTLAALALVAAVLAFHAYQAKQWAAERALLVKAVIARSPSDFVAMNLEPHPKRERSEPEFEQVGI